MPKGARAPTTSIGPRRKPKSWWPTPSELLTPSSQTKKRISWRSEPPVAPQPLEPPSVTEITRAPTCPISPPTSPRFLTRGKPRENLDLAHLPARLRKGRSVGGCPLKERPGNARDRDRSQ